MIATYRATNPAFASHFPAKLQFRVPVALSAKWKHTRFSSRPPRQPPRRQSRDTSVIAWISCDPIQDSLIINAARSSCLPVVTVHYHDPVAVANTARSMGARTVYLAANRNKFCFKVLQAHSLLTIPVRMCGEVTHWSNVRGVPMSNASIAAPAIGSSAPLLLERNGGTVTTFYDSNEKGRGAIGSLTPQKEVDDRPLLDKLVAWLRLGKKVAAGAAATSWVLKDGASYIAKILYGSVFGSKFDDDPKSWRIAADIVEDIGGAIEILTPLFPLTYFLPLASLAVCLKGMSLMTGTATRHVVYRSLAASGMQNTGDIATKGESQGVTMKMLGLGLGIIISSRIGQKYYVLLGAYGLLAVVHIAANWRSVQCVQFSFFNKQRASILIDSHLDRLQMPTPRDVSSIERIVLPPWRGFQSSVKLGAGVAESVTTPKDLAEARKLFGKERFMIFVTDGGNNMKILLQDAAKPVDILRAYYTAKQLKRLNSSSKQALTESLKYMRSNIDSFLKETAAAGWDTRHMLLADDTVRIAW
ncbi:Root UVB sensitive [Gracilaria domingensis]|nr:Root UVB sensitive [Gracilaria domingensis]